jgi:hypothetical protein
VVISEERRARPLVALTAPDKPTVILSNPEPPEQRTAQPERTPAPPQSPQPQPQQQANLPPQPGAGGTPASGEDRLGGSEDGGRLFVSGEAAAGATIRLYLNDTLIAPGGVGGTAKCPSRSGAACGRAITGCGSTTWIR